MRKLLAALVGVALAVTAAAGPSIALELDEELPPASAPVETPEETEATEGDTELDLPEPDFGPPESTFEEQGEEMMFGPLAVEDITIGECTIIAVPTPEQHTVCPGFDFSGEDVGPGLDLSYAELSGAVFGDNWMMQHLVAARGADFTGATFTGVGVEPGADLTGADFSGATLTSTSFFGADLTGTDFSGATLAGTSFMYSVLTGADFSNTTATGWGSVIGNRADGARFVNAHIGPSFRENLLTNADFTGAVFLPTTNAEHNSYVGATFTGAHLPAYMGGSDLLNVNLSDIASSAPSAWDLGGSRVSGADFSGLTITGLYLGGSLAVGTDFSGATFLPGDRYSANSGYWTGVEWRQFDENLSLDGGGTDFTGASFDSATIRGYFKLDGAELRDVGLRALDVTGAFFDIRGSHLPGAVLDGTDYSTTYAATTEGATMSYMSARNTTFPIAGGGVYTNVDFTGARLWVPNVNTQGVWDGPDVRWVTTGNAGGAVWHGVLLDGAQLLGGPQGEDVDFGGASFAELSMAGFDLSKMRLDGAVFYRVDLTGADLRRPADFPTFAGAVFIESNLTGATLPDVQHPFGGTWLTGFRMQDSVFDGTVLASTDIAVTAAAGETEMFVEVPLPAAFANDDGKLPYGPDYDGGFWSGVTYECDSPADGIFPVGTTDVTCRFATLNSYGGSVSDAGLLDMSLGFCGDGSPVPLSAPELTASPTATLLNPDAAGAVLTTEGIIDYIDVGMGGPLIEGSDPYKYTFFQPCSDGVYTAGFRVHSTTSFTVTVHGTPAPAAPAGDVLLVGTGTGVEVPLAVMLLVLLAGAAAALLGAHRSRRNA